MNNKIHSLLLAGMISGLILMGCGSDDLSENLIQDNIQSDKDQEITNPNDHVDNRPEEGNQQTDGSSQEGSVIVDHTADWLGAIEPEKALEYMKTTYDQGLVIVDVTPIEYKLETGFIGSIYIPVTELDIRYDEIPSGKPVILHCVRGRSSAKAYPILEEKRKDIPVLSYIAAEPLIDEFNTWLESRGNTP